MTGDNFSRLRLPCLHSPGTAAIIQSPGATHARTAAGGGGGGAYVQCNELRPASR